MKNRQKGSSVLLVIIIILLAVALVYVLVNKPKKEVTNIPNQETLNTCKEDSPSTIKVISPNGGETFKANKEIVVKWQGCNIDPAVSVLLIKHNPSTPYSQKEESGDYVFDLGNQNSSLGSSYQGSSSDGTQKIVLSSDNPNFEPGQHYFILVTSTGDKTNIGSGYTPSDLSDGLFSIENDDQDNNSTNSNVKDYQNLKAGYNVDYPNSWFLTASVDSSEYNIVEIKNMKVTTLPEGGFKLKENGSQIQIEVNYNMNYKDIAEFTKDPKYMLSQASITERLARDTTMNIGGQKLLVESYVYTPGKGMPGQSYNFVYKGKLYKINFMAGSDTQYNKDLKVFTDLLSSFTLL